jgi:DnaK suppressor protein
MAKKPQKAASKPAKKVAKPVKKAPAKSGKKAAKPAPKKAVPAKKPVPAKKAAPAKKPLPVKKPVPAKKPVAVKKPEPKKALPKKPEPKKPEPKKVELKKPEPKKAAPVVVAPKGKPAPAPAPVAKKAEPVAAKAPPKAAPVPSLLDKVELPPMPTAPREDVQESPVGPIRERPVDETLFSDEELAYFRSLLLAERGKLLDKAREALESGGVKLEKEEMYDEVDLASATVDQALLFKLLDRDRKLLIEIDHALSKIETGDYGYCEGTGDPIPKRRLELRPWTKHSVKYKEYLERMKKSGRGVVDEEETLATPGPALS